MYKYIHKGEDWATMVIESNSQRPCSSARGEHHIVDEIKEYTDCRYISTLESCWRIFDFKTNNRHPSIERLNLHLKDQQTVVFRDDSNLHSIINNPLTQRIMFTEWFEANRKHPSARELTYADFPSKWTWDERSKLWKERQRGKSIGRLYNSHPLSGERYYLRMLLHIIKGPTCYEDLTTVNWRIHDTYKEACFRFVGWWWWMG